MAGETHGNTPQVVITGDDDSTDDGGVDIAYNGFVAECRSASIPMRVGGLSSARSGHVEI